MREIFCDKKGCKRHATFVDEGCDGIHMQLCRKHYEEFMLNDYIPRQINYLDTRVFDLTRQIECGLSEAGHKFENLEKPQKIWNAQHPADGYEFNNTDLDMNASIGGPVHTCVKCGYRYHEPGGEIRLGNIEKIEFRTTIPPSKDCMGRLQ